jgi:murein DD-endopeptidase MepM/ murein hydrolase activator NlpD
MRRYLFFLLIFLSSLLFAQKEYLSIYSEKGDDDSIILYAANSHIIPLWAKLTIETLRGYELTDTNPYAFVINEGLQRQYVTTMKRQKNAQYFQYSLKYQYALGVPGDARHDDDFLYSFPFEHGTKKRLSQSFGGKFTHYGNNEYGLDFEMEIGTPVMAARNGLVIEIKEDSERGGIAASYSGDANYILIKHDDGSYGNYVHLKKNGALVNVGAWVQTGEWIGLSGNTGVSSGPHLHFDVRIPSENGMQSIPIRLLGLLGDGITPKANYYYYAFHRGNPPFETVLGRDITNTDYEGFASPVNATNKIAIRSEQIDMTFVLFIANGLETKADTTIKLQLMNFESSNGKTIRLFLEPLKEVFLTVLKPKQDARSFRYGYRLSYKPLK